MIIHKKNNIQTLELINEEASKKFGPKLASCLKAPLILTFTGEIGTGKTTIIRSMLRALGVESAIKSPTFSLVESYVCQELSIHHFDLYRINQEDELDYLGFRDYFSEQSICCIEWAEHAGKSLPVIDIRFKLEIKGTGRLLIIEALSPAGEHIMTDLVGDK